MIGTRPRLVRIRVDGVDAYSSVKPTFSVTW